MRIYKIKCIDPYKQEIEWGGYEREELFEAIRRFLESDEAEDLYFEYRISPALFEEVRPHFLVRHFAPILSFIFGAIIGILLCTLITILI